MKHLLGIDGLEKHEVEEIINLAAKIKANPALYRESLKGKSMAMIFQKTSTRTRLSFEHGMVQLGGYASFIDWKTGNFQVGDLIDEVKCISGYCDMIMARVNAHADLKKMQESVGIPIINGLSELEHPCQALADLMTILELKPNNPKIAYVGDGNNVCNSLIAICNLWGIKIAAATPEGYEPNNEIAGKALRSGILTLSNDPKKAVHGADFVYTDTWVSLGQEDETLERTKIFPPYQLNNLLLPYGAHAMHCLPAHRGMEITDEVMDSEIFLGFRQSENRLHVQKAVMIKLLQEA